MKFPVDLLADVSQAELERLAHNYMHNLLYSNPDCPEYLALPDSTQVAISISSVGFVPLYGSSVKEKILALFSPSDSLTAVALYLLGQWWTVDDILKTADPARDGAVEVETVGERIVLYILNRVIYRAKERGSEELPFLCHEEKDYAKIMWNNGEAVGFYSVKPSGSLCSPLSTRSYQLPVMDSIFVRKCQRGKGFGLQMLKDFVLSFNEDCLGLRYPLTKPMYKVCEKYLCQYPGDTDLLWEVESTGGPNQRTNISSKIQAMGLSAVSKSLSFTEESVITEVTEKDVVMEAITTQIKETESMECTVEIVEEVTVVRTTKEAELPVAARGRSGGSKRRNMSEKITEDKSEKVIRIEDIEAETPREEQVSAQQKIEIHVSELVQTEVMFSLAPEENKENIVDAAPEEEAATMSDKPTAELVTQDLQEADDTSAPTPEEPHVEDDATKHLNTTSHDSKITVENVASEIEEAEEECDTAVLVVSEEALEVHKEAETVNKMEEGTQIELTDEKSEKIVPQHELNLFTPQTLEGAETGKTGRTVVKARKTAQSETPRRTSERHRKTEEGVKEEAAAQDGQRVLRRRTVTSTPTPKHKYTRHSQRVYEELEKEVDEVAEDNTLSTAAIVEELAVTEGQEPEEITPTEEDVAAVEELGEEKEDQQLEDEQLTNEEETEKGEEPGVDDSALRESSAELPDTADALTEENRDEKVTDESEKEQKGEEVMQDKEEVCDDDIEEPPVVHKRALRGRCKVTHKPIKRSKIHQKQEEGTDEAYLGAGDSASEEKADEKATDKEVLEHHTAEQEVTDEKTEEEVLTEELTVAEDGAIPEAEEATKDVIPVTEVNVEEHKEVQEDAETEGATEEVSVMEADKDEEADDMMQEPASVAAASTEIPDDGQGEAAMIVPEDPQEKDIDSEISKLQKATVVLVDLKTTCHHVSVQEAEETAADGECAAPEMEQMELIAAEEKDVSSCAAEEQTPEPKMLVMEEENGGKQENSTEKSVDVAAEAETVQMEELEGDSSDKEKEESANVEGEASEAEEVPFIETRVLRSGRKVRQHIRQEEDNIDDVITEKKVDEAETCTVEREGEVEEVVAKDAVTVSAEEKPSADIDSPVVDDAEETLPSAEVDGAMSLEEEEAGVKTRALRSKTKTVTATPRRKTTRGRKQADEQEAENSEDEEPAVTTRTLRRGRISAPDTPAGKPRQTRKQIQEQEQKGAEESEGVEEKGEEEAVKEAAVDKIDKEREEQTEEEAGEKVKEEAASEREESLEQEINVEKGKAALEEDVVEEQPEATSKTLAEREVEASGEECDEGKPVMGGEEVELPPVTVTRCLRSGGKASKAPPKGRRGRRNRKQLQKKGPQESAEEAEAEEEEEEEEAGLVSAEEPPTEGGDGKGSVGDEMEVVEEEEAVTVEMEKVVSEEGTMTVTEEGENTAGVTAATGDLVQEEETDTPSPKPATDSAILTASEEEAAASAEEQQSEEMVPQLSDLQRVTVVLVDLKKTHHEVLEDTAAVEEDVPVEKTATEVEERCQETVEDEETMAEEDVPGSPVGKEKTELESVEVEEKGMEEKDKDAVMIQGAGTAEETAEGDEAKVVEEEEEEEEEEPTDTETRRQARRKQALKETPRRKLTRGRQKKGDEEKEETSENTEEEPDVQVRALRMGRKSIPVAQRCTTKRTHKQLQEEEGEEEEGGEESTAVEEEAEEPQQMIDQEKGERLEAKEATQQVENVKPEMELEKSDAAAEEADAPEEGQEGTAETLGGEDTEAPAEQSADEGKTLGGVAAEEPVTAQDTVEGEQSASTSEVAETAAGESTQDTLLTAKDDEAKDVSEEDEAPVTETRVLRKGRRSAVATPRRKSKRAHRQCEAEEEGEDEATPAEETQVEETKAVPDEAKEKEENQDETIEEKNEEEAASQEGETTEPEVETEKEAVAEESLIEQETVDEEQSAVSETCEDGQGETSIGKSPEETPNTDEGEVPAEEEVPTIATRVLRSGGKAVKATLRSKTTKSLQEAHEQEDAVMEDSADTDEPAGRTRGLRRGRRSAPATPRQKSKRARRQRETEEDAEEEPAPAEETEGEEEETAVDETDTVKVLEETKSAEEEETTVIETSTAATQLGSDTAVAEDESQVEDEFVVTEEEAVTTRTLRSKTKTSHATPPRRSRRQKDPRVVETQQQGEEAQEVHQLTDESAENSELNAEQEAETDEPSPAGQETGPPAEDNAEDQAQDTADLTDDRVDEPVEPPGEEPATEETESQEEEPSESEEEKTLDSSAAEGRTLRRRVKTVIDTAEDIQNPKRRSVRKRPRVDYKENDEVDEGVETDTVESDEDKANKKAECSADEPKMEDSRTEEHLESNEGAVASTSENGNVLNLVLDTDEEIQTAGLSQEDEDDEQSVSEEEAEPVVTTGRVLRGRSIPSQIITPPSKSKRRRARVPKSEESFSEGVKSPETAQRRSPRKRKSTEVTPTRKSKRHNRQ